MIAGRTARSASSTSFMTRRLAREAHSNVLYLARAREMAAEWKRVEALPYDDQLSALKRLSGLA
jgi:hypothetical protein